MNKVDKLKLCFSCIDLTSLNHTDNENTISALVEKVNQIGTKFAGIPNVAAICVYPSLVSVVKKTLTNKNVKIASVAGGFPASLTFSDVKILECTEAVKSGANELDIVLPVGEFLQGNYDKVLKEIAFIKQKTLAHLKVILETGTLKTPEMIEKASWIAMEAGADFIKTSTGKTEPAATCNAFAVMANAVKSFYEKTGRQVGLKAAGGIVEANDAMEYFAIVEDILGENYLNSEYFRIGASRLANNLLSEIVGESIKIF